MSSLYARYIKEREGKSIIENEDSFVSYKINGPEVYLSDIFISEESRTLSRFRALINQVAEIGKANECDIITANIHLADPNANKTLKVSMHVGFKVKDANGGILLLVKKIKEDF